MVTRVANGSFRGLEALRGLCPVQVPRAMSAFVLRRLARQGGGGIEGARARRPDRLRAWLCRRGGSSSISLPADLPKEGSHYDLPIALGIMAPSARSHPMR